MLYQTFKMIKIEAQKRNQNFVQVNESTFDVALQTNVGSLLDLSIKLKFFSDEPIRDEMGASYMDIDE